MPAWPRAGYDLLRWQSTQAIVGYQSIALTVPDALAAVDFGIGIRATARAYLRRPSRSAAEAIAWARRRGTTTKPGSISRGLGLGLLKILAKANTGRLEIFSGGGYAVITEFVEHGVGCGPAVEGTAVNISLRCVEAYYRLDSEPTDGPLF